MADLSNFMIHKTYIALYDSNRIYQELELEKLPPSEYKLKLFSGNSDNTPIPLLSNYLENNKIYDKDVTGWWDDEENNKAIHYNEGPLLKQFYEIPKGTYIYIYELEDDTFAVIWSKDKIFRKLFDLFEMTKFNFNVFKIIEKMDIHTKRFKLEPILV